MGPYYYVVKKLDGDYAHLERTDLPEEEPILVARALLPQEIEEGSRRLWENLMYTRLEE